MTVVAYRAGVMACDSRWSTDGYQTVRHTKIHRLSSGALLGQAGDNDSREVVMLFDKIKTPDRLPLPRQLLELRVDFSGLLALPRGGLFEISIARPNEHGNLPDDCDVGVWPGGTIGGYGAVGSGRWVALGAMDAGASARRAVEVACERDVYCGLPVCVVRLHAKPTKA
jgi:hypothetical protein